MKRLYVKKEEIVTTCEPTEFCGIKYKVTFSKGKAYVVYHNYQYRIVGYEIDCLSCFNHKEFDSIKEVTYFLENNTNVTKIFFFDNNKELHTWLISDEDL